MNLLERDFITEPGAWVGPEIQAAENWIYHFSVADIAEIDAALDRVKSEGIEIPFPYRTIV